MSSGVSEPRSERIEIARRHDELLMPTSATSPICSAKLGPSDATFRMTSDVVRSISELNGCRSPITANASGDVSFGIVAKSCHVPPATRYEYPVSGCSPSTSAVAKPRSVAASIVVVVPSGRRRSSAASPPPVHQLTAIDVPGSPGQEMTGAGTMPVGAVTQDRSAVSASARTINLAFILSSIVDSSDCWDPTIPLSPASRMWYPGVVGRWPIFSVLLLKDQPCKLHDSIPRF